MSYNKHSFAPGICQLKRALKKVSIGAAVLQEPVPLYNSDMVPIDDSLLEAVHRFANSNPIYQRSHVFKLDKLPCRVYEGDGTVYWLNSKKNDANYQAFYATWMLSALALAIEAKQLGYSRLIDIGAGDGRIPYFAKIVGLEAHAIELDLELVHLQDMIRRATLVDFDAVQGDATKFDFGQFDLNGAILFISALPELGEMIANAVVSRILACNLKHSVGFCLTGSVEMRSMARDSVSYGWGNLIRENRLNVEEVMHLPTQWTSETPTDTPYVFTRQALGFS